MILLHVGLAIWRYSDASLDRETCFKYRDGLLTPSGWESKTTISAISEAMCAMICVASATYCPAFNYASQGGICSFLSCRDVNRLDIGHSKDKLYISKENNCTLYLENLAQGKM